MTSKVRERGWWYPWIFVAGFAVVFCVNGFMVYISKQAYTAGSVSASPYEDGLRYNEVLAAAKAQQKLGWNISLRSEIVTEKTGDAPRLRLFLETRDQNNAFLQNSTVEAMMYRPIGASLDRKFTFDKQADFYTADLTLPAAGVWEARILIRNGTDEYRLHQRVYAR